MREHVVHSSEHRGERTAAEAPNRSYEAAELTELLAITAPPTVQPQGNITGQQPEGEKSTEIHGCVCRRKNRTRIQRLD